MYVYVLDIDGQPLMPTKRYGKVRRLLRDKKAIVVKRCPFTIKLLYDVKTKEVQECVLGIDTGTGFIGSAVFSEGKILYASQIELRNDIKSNMDERRQFRRNRRNRKTRYRKARFLNRANSTKLNRLPPSVKHKVQAHIDEILFCFKILPISILVLEVSQFDTHLMKNPSLLNEKIKHWGYQKGFNYSFASRKEAVLNRDNYTCQVCGKKNTRLEVHHIIFRSNGGTDDENNLITLCESCHKKVHSGEIELNKKVKKMNLKNATQMSIIRSQLLKTFTEAIETFGFVTKENRVALELPKEHYVDASIIASGGKEVELLNCVFFKKRVSKGDYKLCKGKRGEIRLPTGKIQGFRKFDKVLYFGKEYFISGRRSVGTATLMDIFGNVIDFSYMPRGLKTPKLSNMRRISDRKSTICFQQFISISKEI